ncbi:HET-domain-containing protein [Xylaria acuta]|nr:HET-domain-containing protein [Xylaria acuta]
MPFCPLCSNLDFSAISRTSVRDLFLFSEKVYPDHSPFSYIPRDYNLPQTEHNLTPHHDSLSSLSINAKSCELCCLIQSSIGVFLKGSESREKLGFSCRTPDYELWLGGRDGADGFQILGLMGGVGYCLRNDFMPTRLLEIADFGRQVCLHFPGTEHSRYAVLSHCWGPVAPTTLTSRTLHKLEAGIRTEELPQTFQDAVWLTHQLEIQFLWIDSLCIVQDDPNDWAQESAKMHSVYNNSFVTIAASRATKSSEGFLGNRVEKSYVAVPFHCQGIAGEVLAFSLPLSHVGDPTRSVRMEHEPLSHRGWALQERYLSRRTLHFGSDQIFFECEKYCVAENTFEGNKYPSISQIRSSGRLEEMNECLREWHRLVEMYSMRKLTHRDDKLPALSGLAAYLSRQLSVESDAMDLSSRYLAGLWSDDIIGELCWGVNGRGTRPVKYRAPSWSWASLDGSIRYYTIPHKNELAAVQSIHVDLESPSRSFGKVLGGWISVKAIKLRPHADSTGNLRFSEDGVSFALGCAWDLESFAASGRRESLLSMMKETELVVMLLGWIEFQDQRQDDERLFGPYCLILKRVDCSNHSETTPPIYQRIGFGVAIAESEGNNNLSRLKLKQLITDKWTVMKKQGNLEDILIT